MAQTMKFRHNLLKYRWLAIRPAMLRGLRRARILVPALMLALHAGYGVSRAGEGGMAEPPPAAAAVPWPEPAPWQENAPWPGPVPWTKAAPWTGSVPATGYFTTLEKRMDSTHAMLERNILRQTVNLDNFFGSTKPEKHRQTGYSLRWRNSLSVVQGRKWNFGASLQANFTLSKISERLHIFFSGEDDPGLTRQGLPEDPGNPGFDRTTPTTHFANTELRYELIRNQSLNLFLGAGVRLVLPFEVFARSRVSYVHDFNDKFLMRCAETLFVKNTDLFGATTEFSLERLVAGDTLLRWASAGTASREIGGLEWGSELSLTWQPSPKDAITLKSAVFGNTSLPDLAQNYLLLALYRRNFLRSWLFYELEPQVSWPRNPAGVQTAVYSFTFRLEVTFHGMAARQAADTEIKKNEPAPHKNSR